MTQSLKTPQVAQKAKTCRTCIYLAPRKSKLHRYQSTCLLTNQVKDLNTHACEFYERK